MVLSFFLSEPIDFKACNKAVMIAIIKKMLNNSPAAIRLALNMVCKPSIIEPE